MKPPDKESGEKSKHHSSASKMLQISALPNAFCDKWHLFGAENQGNARYRCSHALFRGSLRGQQKPQAATLFHAPGLLAGRLAEAPEKVGADRPLDRPAGILGH